MNDDRLTADLHDAFRAATADLTYDRAAPRLRRTPAYAVPAATAGLVAAGVATVVLLPSLTGSPAATTSDAAAPDGSNDTATSSTASTASAVRGGVLELRAVVTVAGTSYTFTREDPAQGRLVARDVDALPAGAEPVETSAAARAWFGAEPTTGDPALFVQAPTRDDGDLFSLSGPGWTREQLVAVLDGGQPQVVPHVD